MLEDRAARPSGENVWLWLAKLVTGVGIIVLLLVHLVVNHFVAEGGLLTHADVVEYYANPWIVLMEAVFLVFVVSHSLIGMRSILLDLGPSQTLLRIVDGAFLVLGVVSVVYGLWLLQAVVALG